MDKTLGRVIEVVHQPYGHAGLTFEVRTAGGAYIVKTRHEPGAFDFSQWHFTVLRGLGISTPIIVSQGKTADFEYLVLEKIPGRDLGYELGQMSKTQMTKLAEQIVVIQRKVGSLPHGNGYGWTPMPIAGPFPSWNAVIERDLKSSPGEVQAVADEWSSDFDGIQPTCFLDDLTVKNVIVQEGALQGIVDLDSVCYGDPLYWLSLAEVTVVLDVGLPATFYGEELRRLWGMSDKSAARCNLYNVIQAWFFLSKDPSQEPLREWAANRLRQV